MKLKFTAVFVITLFSFLKIYSANAQVNKQDSLAMVNLYNSTNGPGWRESYKLVNECASGKLVRNNCNKQ